MIDTIEITKAIKPVLDEFEWQEYCNTGMRRLNGGFTKADLEDVYEDDNGWVYIELRWGIKDGDEDTVHTEHYKISLDMLLSDKSVKEKVFSIEVS